MSLSKATVIFRVSETLPRLFVGNSDPMGLGQACAGTARINSGATCPVARLQNPP